MSQDLQKLAVSSEEARAIFNNFASRLRVHKNKALDISRFYHHFTSKGRRFNKMIFENVFIELEKLGYGVVGKSSSGAIREFLPEVHVKFIGMEAKPIIQQEDPIIEQNKVLVMFTLKGLKCRAEVPKEALDEFEELISI